MRNYNHAFIKKMKRDSSGNKSDSRYYLDRPYGEPGTYISDSFDSSLVCEVLGNDMDQIKTRANLLSAAPEMLDALKGCAVALKEAGKDFALWNRNATRPNLYEIHAKHARKIIDKATCKIV